MLFKIIFLNTSSAGVTMDACGNIKLNADANSTHILLSSSNDIDLYAATDISLNAVEGNIMLNAQQGSVTMDIQRDLTIDSSRNITMNSDLATLSLDVCGNAAMYSNGVDNSLLLSTTTVLDVQSTSDISFNAHQGSFNIDVSRNVSIVCDTFSVTASTEEKQLRVILLLPRSTKR